MSTEAPTTEERYARATRSSHLEMTEAPGDVDTIIAAGLAQEGLGTYIWRLMVEFDGVRATVRRGPLNGAEKVLVLSQLKTLAEARRRLGAFAVIRATKGRHMIPDVTVAQITGRVLDVYLDPLCHHCDGRGFNGGSHRGERQAVCRPCRGSGNRRGWIGKTQAEQSFAQHLLAELDRALGELGACVKRYRPLVDEAKRNIALGAKMP